MSILTLCACCLVLQSSLSLSPFMVRGGHLSMSILNKGNEDISKQVPLKQQISLLLEGSLDYSV